MYIKRQPKYGSILINLGKKAVVNINKDKHACLPLYIVKKIWLTVLEFAIEELLEECLE
jgi:hypothetical protein